MARIEIIKPVDQVTGRRRLLDEIKSGLDSVEFSDMRWIVAYAKAGPLQRLQSRFEAWRKRGNTVRAIFGVDQQGTSKEALELALGVCDEVYVTQERSITFHPEAYMFIGAHKARFYIGSNNLTVGGTETNFEAAILVEAVLPADQAVFTEFGDFWNQLLPNVCPATRTLDKTLLNSLVASGDVLDEATIRKVAKTHGETGKSKKLKSGLKLQPPSPLPPAPQAAKATPVKPAIGHEITTSVSVPKAGGLAIEIVPHDNGEIFLSKMATNQNPGFFDFPYTGKTTPKKKGGKPYPQRVPDPIVNIQVYGANNALILKDEAFGLNTVFYEPNSEIRITASKLVPVVPAYSVLVMTPSPVEGTDYDMTVYRPDSPDYAAWEAVCNQTMPSGGSARARKFGWF